MTEQEKDRTLVQIFKTESGELCLADKDTPPDIFCGACWHSSATNHVCTGLFYLFVLIFVTTIILMTCYHQKRKKAQVDVRSKSFYFVFAFIICWILSRIIFFTDAFYNFDIDIQALMNIMPMIFTYLTIEIAIYNM